MASRTGERRQNIQRRRIFTGVSAAAVLIIIVSIVVILTTGNSEPERKSVLAYDTAQAAETLTQPESGDASDDLPEITESEAPDTGIEPSSDTDVGIFDGEEAQFDDTVDTSDTFDMPSDTDENVFETTSDTVSWHTFPTKSNAKNIVSLVTPDLVDGFMPVCFGCKTDRKILAFTIDDCNQPANMQAIIDLFKSYNGKATFFPIGENVQKCSSQLLDAYNSGFEIENHTWDHSGLYCESDKGLANEITAQNAAVNKLLGVNYQMHFLRPRGGDNRYDQRTHAYIRQKGYYGIAYWAHVGVHTSSDTLVNNAKNGDIYLFHTTDDDLKQLKDIVPRLAKAGYTFVTLNELYDLPANETSEYIEITSGEPLEPYTRFSQLLKPGDYLHDVYLMQEKLSELGYLKSDYNGFFGETTEKALKAFQKAKGLSPDGICGDATWNALFSN